MEFDEQLNNVVEKYRILFLCNVDIYSYNTHRDFDILRKLSILRKDRFLANEHMYRYLYL